jgi:hypothetical protein
MQYKPASITVIAVQQLVFGGVGILFGICTGISMAVGGQNWFYQSGGADPNQAEMMKLQKDLQNAIESGPAYQAVQVGELTANLALSIAMILSGIGLLRVRPWGRLLSIIYAGVSIALKILGMVYSLAFIIPAFTNFLDTHEGHSPPEQMVLNFMRIVVYFPPIFYLVFMIYPIIVLIIMFRPAVSEAFREGGTPSRHTNADYEER